MSTRDMRGPEDALERILDRLKGTVSALEHNVRHLKSEIDKVEVEGRLEPIHAKLLKDVSELEKVAHSVGEEIDDLWHRLAKEYEKYAK